MGKFIAFIKDVRKARKKVRKEAKVITEFQAISDEPWHDKFKLAWGVIASSLEVLKLITKDKVDDVIDNIISVGNRIARKEASPGDEKWFLEIWGEYWKWIKIALLVVMGFTNNKVDKVIEQIIVWGDIMESDPPAIS